MQQLDLHRPLAEELLAQQGVEVDAAELALLVALGRGPTGLVVGDHEATVRVELEPVDDADELEPLDLGLEAQLDADGRDHRGVFEQELVANQLLGLGDELGRLVIGQPELDELGVGLQLDGSIGEAAQGGFDGAGGGGQGEQPLEGRVHQRALDRRGRRWLGEVVDGREAKRQGAVGEGGDLRR